MRSLGAVPAHRVYGPSEHLFHADTRRAIALDPRTFGFRRHGSAMKLFMQEAYGLSNIPAEVAPAGVPLLAYRPVEAVPRKEHDPRFAEYASTDLPSTQDCSLEKLRNAVVDLLHAVSRAFQDEPEEAYGCVLHAAELLRKEASSAIAGLNLDGGQSAGPPTLRGGLAPWMVRRVSTHIETHLDSAISSADLAGLIKQSVYHFCRAFRESFNESPHRYVMRRRIERAQGLMLQTNMSLAQVAIECGLADQAHLNKSFRRFVGESPSAWRRARTARAQ
jgi:AraC family transcriptional regulator